ncbi:MAG: CRISPR-associated endonuclease Cas1 [Armatimonadetes bacterium]|nr:CRISPR-associated endonuclease Cas1 [Armatimonadota bacterium]
MPTLYVDEYGARVRFSQGLIVVEKDGDELSSVRLQELDSVVIQENCGITSSAVCAFLRGGVDVCFITRGGEYVGKLEPAEGKNVLLRREQYAAADDPAFALGIARAAVAGKLRNMRTILMRYARTDRPMQADDPTARLRAAADSTASCPSIEALLGIEGSGTREYFAAFPAILEGQWRFSGRNRRPPEDPVNAMLGFAYALLENELERSVSVCGLDPYCGFLHQDQYGRQSLVLDLMEEFRPVIADSVVLSCSSRGMLDPDAHFEERDGGVYLNEPGRQKFFAAFYGRMKETVTAAPGEPAASYREVCVRQARSIASCIKRRTPDYAAFTVK